MEIEYNYYLNSKPNKRDHKFPYNKIYKIKNKTIKIHSMQIPYHCVMISLSTINI